MIEKVTIDSKERRRKESDASLFRGVCRVVAVVYAIIAIAAAGDYLQEFLR